MRRYQFAKRADTFMFVYLFSLTELREVFSDLDYELFDERLRQTIDYYGARVTRGSTLSRVIDAWIAARADRRTSWHRAEALAADMADTQGGCPKEGRPPRRHGWHRRRALALLYRSRDTERDTQFRPRAPLRAHEPSPHPHICSHQLEVMVDHRKITVAFTLSGAPPLTLVLAVDRRASL